MGFDGIILIRGAVVDFTKVLQYFASVNKLQRIVDWFNENIASSLDVEEILIVNDDTPKILAEYSEQFLDEICENFIENPFSEDFVHTWPCCSDLRMKKFVLGYAVKIPEREYLHDCFHDICVLQNPEIKTNSRDEEIITKLDPLGVIKEELKTMIIPDGCPSCT